MKLYKLVPSLLTRNMQFGGDLEVIMNCFGAHCIQILYNRAGRSRLLDFKGTFSFDD